MEWEKRMIERNKRRMETIMFTRSIEKRADKEEFLPHLLISPLQFRFDFRSDSDLLLQEKAVKLILYLNRTCLGKTKDKNINTRTYRGAEVLC